MKRELNYHHHSPGIASSVEEAAPSQTERDPQDDQGGNLTSSQMCCYDDGWAQQL